MEVSSIKFWQAHQLLAESAIHELEALKKHICTPDDFDSDRSEIDQAIKSASDQRDLAYDMVYIPTQIDVDRIIEIADELFWHTVASELPQFKTGDMLPDQCNALRVAMQSAVSGWIKNNTPERVKA